MDSQDSEREYLSSRLESLGWGKNDIEEVREIVEEYRNKPGVSKIWLYGSMARGGFDRKKGKLSDIDIAVEVDDLDERGWKTDRRHRGERSRREVQIQMFRAGFDKEVAARPVMHWQDKSIRQLAEQRLRDQIVLWKR